jgi:hypothetical protein
MCQGLNWNRKRSSETEVTDLNISLLINQQILWFQIPMNDSLRVAVVDASEELVDHLLDLRLAHVLLVFPHVLLQVILDEFENQVKLLLLRLKHDLFQTS